MSGFGELLRRSRFASYDSTIPQAYCSPQAYARRGDYGLKRALPLRYKDSSVTVSHVDHHAQFTNWNNASPLVRFVSRYQELNMTPRTMPTGSWDQSLGDAKLHWLIDSEFAPNHYSKPFNSQSVSSHHSEPLNVKSASNSEPLDPKVASNPKLLKPQLASNTHTEPRDGLGRLGVGAYGAKRPPPQQSSYTPNPAQLNIMSLSPRKFRAYLAKLPALSASYRDYLREEQKVPHSSEEEHTVLYIVSQPQYTPQKLHRSFLAKHFSATSPPISTRKSKKITTPTVSVSQNIERQPHRTGGLVYAHFSPLETVFTTPPQTGFVFQEEPQPINKYFTSDKNRNNVHYLSLVGGIVASLRKSKADIYLPFYNPHHDVAVGGKSVEKFDPLPEPASDSDLPPESAPAPQRGSNSSPAWNFDSISFNEPLEPLESSTPPPPPPPDPVDEVDPFRLQKAVAPIRILTFAIRAPPAAVSTYRAHLLRPKDIMNSLSVSATSAVMEPKLASANLHRVGSMEYSGHLEFSPKNRFDRGGVGTARYGATAYGVNYPVPNKEGAKLGSRPSGVSYGEPKNTTNPSEYEAMFQNKNLRGAKDRQKWGKLNHGDRRWGTEAGDGKQV